MDVRQQTIQTPEKGRAQQKTQDDGYKGKAPQVSGKFKCGLEQAEKGGGQHHAPGRAQQAVHGPARKLAAGENDRRAKAYG